MIPNHTLPTILKKGVGSPSWLAPYGLSMLYIGVYPLVIGLYGSLSVFMKNKLEYVLFIPQIHWIIEIICGIGVGN
jgi:hypothetical protein